jgi:hypothetical protein
VLALTAANLPFLNEKLLAVVPFRRKAGAGGAAGEGARPWRKPLAVRLLEMILLYLVVGAIGFFLEARIGNAFPQTWEFYAITASFFVVLAFPGFVLRYLRKPR